MILWLLAACGPDPATIEGCSAHTGDPQSIDEALDHLSSLPLPVTLPCFLASLQRPLLLEATSDVFSAQPAVGEQSPRIFIQSGALTLSVVPEGVGQPLLEFGQLLDDGRSLKGELHFPLEDPPGSTAPFERVEYPDGGTNCGGCHGHEGEIEPGRYASDPLRPTPRKAVSIPWLATQAEACLDPSERCAILDGVFGHGPVEHLPLPASWGTIYEPIPDR